MQSIINEIRKIGRGDWVLITEVADRLDVTPEQMSAAIKHLLRTEESFDLMPESNQKCLTKWDRAYAVRAGGVENHLIKWH